MSLVFHGIQQSTWLECWLCMLYTCMQCTCMQYVVLRTADNKVDGYSCSWLWCGQHQLGERCGAHSCFSLDGIPWWNLGPCSQVTAIITWSWSMASQQVARWLHATEFKFINSLAVYFTIQRPCIADCDVNIVYEERPPPFLSFHMQFGTWRRNCPAGTPFPCMHCMTK